MYKTKILFHANIGDEGNAKNIMLAVQFHNLNKKAELLAIPFAICLRKRGCVVEASKLTVNS